MNIRGCARTAGTGHAGDKPTGVEELGGDAHDVKVGGRLRLNPAFLIVLPWWKFETEWT
ncbi:hypothetical protein [Mycobacterium genavense]|uniref:hypothetical protein n=1 Tax=Mycobacterium genavense TaxID=36812 RepID=UPI0004B156B4|nr:hypothetical protein [Mycobacterium genavense]